MHRLATVHVRDNQPTNQRRHDTAYLNKRLFYERKVRRLKTMFTKHSHDVENAVRITFAHMTSLHYFYALAGSDWMTLSFLFLSRISCSSHLPIHYSSLYTPPSHRFHP